MTHMNVTPEDLTATANVLQRSVDSLIQLQSSVAEAQVPSGAFGRIPGLGPHLDNVYTDHVTQSNDMVVGAGNGLAATVNSLHATATGMQQLEGNTVDMINQSVPS